MKAHWENDILQGEAEILENGDKTLCTFKNGKPVGK